MKKIDKMESTVKQRLIRFILDKKISVNRFEKETGLSTGYVNNIRVSIQPDKIQRIVQKFPDLNPGWLLTGEGEMLKTATTKNDISTTDNYVLLLPLSAQGGSLGEFTQSVRAEDCERIKSPIDGIDFAIAVSGDSMAPEYPNGSRVLIKRIDDRAFIEWGRVYVLDTPNGSVIKVVTPSKKDGFVTCSSLNEDPRYAPFDVNMKDVYGVYRVMLCMSLK